MYSPSFSTWKTLILFFVLLLFLSFFLSFVLSFFSRCQNMAGLGRCRDCCCCCWVRFRLATKECSLTVHFQCRLSYGVCTAPVGKSHASTSAQVQNPNSGSYIFLQCLDTRKCEPVWPSGKALGWQAEEPRFESASALLSLQELWSVDTVS